MQRNSQKYDLRNTANQAVRREIAFKEANIDFSDKDIQAYFYLKELERTNSTYLASLLAEFQRRKAISHSLSDLFKQTNDLTPPNTSIKKYAFIDGQNFYKEIRKAGWKLNWQSFRNYLTDNLVSKAFIFLGYIHENQHIYEKLDKAGFILKFRQVERLKDGKFNKANCDADLAFFAGNLKTEYDKAIIVANDGDFSQMLKSLYRQDKLDFLLSPHDVKRTSRLIKKVIPISLIKSVNTIKDLVES